MVVLSANHDDPRVIREELLYNDDLDGHRDSDSYVNARVKSERAKSDVARFIQRRYRGNKGRMSARRTRRRRGSIKSAVRRGAKAKRRRTRRRGKRRRTKRIVRRK